MKALPAQPSLYQTMLTAVTERRRELGLLRIVGATRRQVIGRLLLEAAVLGVAGGAGGLLAGTLAVDALNALGERLGAPVFLLTPRLAVIAILLPGALAALAGWWPAWRAVRLPPAAAARYV